MSGSFKFAVTNGVRQGAVSSPILFNVYIDKLIKLLRSSKIGCSIGHIYYGIMVYADDIVLLCPSRIGLQAMLDICEKYAVSHNLQFSTNIDPVKSKTKCIHFSKKIINLAEMELNGDKLPWVDSANHVGNILERNNSFEKDIRSKKGTFISRVHSILQEFSFANPLVKLKMISIYATSFYGSSLWDFFNGQCDKLYTAWNNAIRDTFSLPRMSHRYLIEELSGHLHPKVMLCSRFLQFHSSLLNSGKSCLRYLVELSRYNQRTIYCHNLTEMSKAISCPLENLTSRLIKRNMKYFGTPDDQKWRVAVLQDLQELRFYSLEIDGFLDDYELTAWIDAIAVS